MDNNGRDTKHTRHISRRIHFVINGEGCNIHTKVHCEVGIQLVNTLTDNVIKD